MGRSAALGAGGQCEGAAAVARYKGQEFLGRIVFSWSCENNYFVRSHGTALPDDKPVLNIISSTDPYFPSPANSWLGNPTAAGHCAAALRNNKQASIVLIPGAPHTVLNLPAARHPVAGFPAGRVQAAESCQHGLKNGPGNPGS